MNSLLIFLTLGVCVAVLFVVPKEAPGALACCIAISIPTLVVLIRSGPQRTFLLRLFILGVLVRILLATVIYVGHMEEFFGGDANTYSVFGQSLNLSWHGDVYHTARYVGFTQSGAGAWGMLYLVAAIYEVVGTNLYAVQLVNASVGAATACVVYFTARTLFNNERVSRLASALVCFFPSLILWSSQALKDSLIVMALALAILSTLRLMDKITARQVCILTACLLGLLSLRFYIFYMMTAAVAGSFIIGMKSMNAQSFLSRFVAVAVIGLAFTWFGVVRYANVQFERFGNLRMVQMSRQDQARTAESGFAKDVDVGTTEGALSAIPIGFLYLLFAPFPWQLTSVRQSIALPEMIVWWFSFPLLVLGLWFGVRQRLRQVAPIVMFTTMLTLAYSLFQGNVGTAYRQRSQLLVFYFIFVAVGAIILRERYEDKRSQQVRAKEDLAQLQAARARARRQAKEFEQTESVRST
jgi:4-amino-4-deoxy-L-arabinose transferase-like glycosyltransferase